MSEVEQQSAQVDNNQTSTPPKECESCKYEKNKSINLIEGTNKCAVCGNPVSWIPEVVKVRFSNDFTKKAEEYINDNPLPTIQGFADLLKVSPETLWGWATKKRKDEKGNPTDQPARPSFLNILNKIKKIERDGTAEEKLNAKQELFCQLYASDTEFFGNGVQAYIEVYEPDQSKPNWYKTACQSASRLLSNVKVFTRINELLEVGGLNDVNVDKQMQFLINQQADFSAKLGAIKEYNKLKKRITDKLDVTSDGKPLPIQVVSYKEDK